MNLLLLVLASLVSTLRDVLPITVVIISFQLIVLRRPISQWKRVVAGFACVILGLALFLVGLELALFPLGKAMATQLADPAFVDPGAALNLDPPASIPWYRYHWTYLFAFAIGFSATIAEPALLAVAIKAHEISGGTLQIWPLRAAVALGSGVGVMLGTVRHHARSCDQRRTCDWNREFSRSRAARTDGASQGFRMRRPYRVSSCRSCASCLGSLVDHRIEQLERFASLGAEFRSASPGEPMLPNLETKKILWTREHASKKSIPQLPYPR